MTVEYPITLIYRRRVDDDIAPVLIMRVEIPTDGTTVEGWGSTIQDAWNQLAEGVDAKMHELGWLAGEGR